MHTSIAILRHATASSHVALTLVCWLLHGVFLYEHLDDEVMYKRNVMRTYTEVCVDSREGEFIHILSILSF